MKTQLLQIGKLALAALLLLLATQLASGQGTQVTIPDTVCAQTQDVIYGVQNSNPSSQYFWWFASGGAHGTIDSTISPNDSTIQVDWGAPGDDTLHVVERSLSGCYGDTVSLAIHLDSLPTITFIGKDSVCINEAGWLPIELTGEAPWTITYEDTVGTTYTYTTSQSLDTIAAGGFSSNGDYPIQITGLSDANGCDADSTGLPSEEIHVYPKPGAGPIYHYN